MNMLHGDITSFSKIVTLARKKREYLKKKSMCFFFFSVFVWYYYFTYIGKIVKMGMSSLPALQVPK